MSNDHYVRVGRSGTDIDSFEEVIAAVDRLVRSKWGGWSQANREDLESIVLEKYFSHFGRARLPDGPDGEREVPVAWLRAVIKNAGIDLHRRREARPQEVADLFDQDNPEVERMLLGALAGVPSLSTVVTTQMALQSAFRALRDAYPSDAKLIGWSVIEDLSLTEVARLAGKNDEATKRAIQRAKKRLRDLIEVALRADG